MYPITIITITPHAFLDANITTFPFYLYQQRNFQMKLPFIRSLYRRIPLEFYGKALQRFYSLFGALWAIINQVKILIPF